MRYTMTIKKAEDLEPDYFLASPQHPTGVLLVHKIVEIEPIDDGKFIEITTEEGRKHVVNADDWVLVAF